MKPACASDQQQRTNNNRGLRFLLSPTTTGL